MKNNISILLFLFSLTFSFGQSKEDVLECLEVIFDQPDFQPAFSNDVISGGGIVITSKQKIPLRENKLQKIRSSLTQDDFFDSDFTVKVVQGEGDELERLGIDIRYVLNFFVGGDEEKLIFMLDTFVRNENLQYRWNYSLIKNEDGEWIINSRNLNKQR